MKIDKPENNTYCATIVKIGAIISLENCDNVVATSLFGYQGIISKDTQVGDVGIVFPAETQLSEEFCFFNNLYRHNDRNEDQTQKGYIEDNRRVKAVKFRGNRSDCLFMSLESLSWTGVKLTDLKVGDEFDHLNGKEICKKYVRVSRGNHTNKQTVAKRFERVEPRFLPEHFHTDHYFKFYMDIDPETEVIVSQKIHGTSIRIGNTIVKRKLSLFEKLLSKLGVHIETTEYDVVYGSRKVIKDINNPYQKSYYGTDIWTTEGEKIKDMIPKNYVLYGELIGYTPEGMAIQKDYTYGIEQGKCELYIYRVAVINADGVSQDLTWDHMVEFCNSIGARVVPEIWRGKLKDLKIEDYLDKRLFDEGYRHCISLGENSFVDEGVVVRVDRRTPYCMKAKGSLFLEHETKLLDQEVEDIEAEQEA